MKNELNVKIAFHPGETLLEKLQEVGITIVDFAMSIGYSPETINAIITGRNAVSHEDAKVFEKSLKIPATFWIKKQKNFDKYVKKQSKEKRKLKTKQITNLLIDFLKTIS